MEQQRLAYAPQEQGYWGTAGTTPYLSIGTPHGTQAYQPDPADIAGLSAGTGVIGALDPED
jgi:hypothetical protein